MQNDFFSGGDSRNALGIFCRAPRLGEVKTRLAQTRGDEFALGLYRAMLRDTFDLARELSPDVTTFAIYTPENAFVDEASFVDESTLNPFWNGPRLAQNDGDLGARMLDAFAQLRNRGFERIALIGSDSPDLPLARLKRTFETLRSSTLVFGPAHDGGFYLIGASIDVPEWLFEDVKWSQTDTLERIEINANRRLNLARLLYWQDVDDEDDLLELRRRLFDLKTRAPRTKAWLERNP